MNMKKDKNPAAKPLEAILNREGIPVFTMAVTHLYDVGYRSMTEENVVATVTSIYKKDDSHAFMTNEFSAKLVEIAFEISKVATPLQLAKYVAQYIDPI
jgi:hypothetical protein